MFDYLFSKNGSVGVAPVLADDMHYVPLVWSEHCMECAAPLCYKTCKRYQPRLDHHCVRIADGIKYEGSFTVIKFKSWSKIEALYKPYTVSGREYKKLSQKIAAFDRLNKTVLKFSFGRITRLISDIDFSFRQKLINKSLSGRRIPEALRLNIVCKADKKLKMCVDIKTSKLIFREAFDVDTQIGEYNISIPVIDVAKELHFINIHPVDAEAEVCLYVQNLEMEESSCSASNKKVKCCIWDLDNTLWKGILIEDRSVHVNKHLIDFIKETDRKGIIHSISSKNTYEDANSKLEELGIRDYFVFPKINWNPKGQNIKQMVRQLNINADTIIFIDDNPFERAEVANCVEGITCVDPSDFIEWSISERFDIKVSSESSERRKTYQMKEKMQQEEESWTGNIDDFLISCKLKATLTHPDESNIERCFELLQRSNQLNSSGRRIPFEILKDIVAANGENCYVIAADDRFGNYGIVGFIIIDIHCKIPTVTDFVISCRVANRKLEPTVLNHLSSKYGGKLHMNFVKTDRNAPIKAVLDDLNASLLADKSEGQQVYSLSYIKDYLQIVSIEEV